MFAFYLFSAKVFSIMVPLASIRRNWKPAISRHEVSSLFWKPCCNSHRRQDRPNFLMTTCVPTLLLP